MPPSGRKGKTRAKKSAAVENAEPSDVETPEAIATPSRTSRKRAREVETAPPGGRMKRRRPRDTVALEREDTEGTEAQEETENEVEFTGPTEQDIIEHLKVAHRHVNASSDYANDLLEGQEHVPGYGKIAGRDWSFIIRRLEVNIGRPEAHEKMLPSANGEPPEPSHKTLIDIDLGPDRQVSRSHAVIAYDQHEGRWFIIVNGRNGLHVDNNPLQRGMKTYLRNGSVIEIAHTQMAFITTATEDGEGPIWDASIIKQAQRSSEEDDEDEDDTHVNGRRHQMHPSSHAPLTEPGAHPPDVGGQQQYRTHPHSQRAMNMPGTPMRSQQQYMKSSPAANYARGVMMESTESIDYSSDSAKDLKPPHSYAQLIGMAILSTPDQQMTLSNIYKWIMANYAFYRFNTGGWQNSIRHNLSLNKAFTKIARRTDEPGKGMKWMIEPTEFDTFVQQGMKGCRRPAPLPATQSNFGSPVSPAHSRGHINGMPKHEDELTPPMQSFQPNYPIPTEAYTPDRGPRRQAEAHLGLGINGDAEADFTTRSTPRNGLTAIANAAGSPPALYINDETRIGPLDTPFPLRPSQRLAPPSTLKRPSDFIQFSSPAPFWKMDGLIGSTPFKPYDLSPLKTPFSGLNRNATNIAKADRPTSATEEKSVEDAAGDEEANDKRSPIIHSSSPPPHSAGAALDASPTLSRPATAVAKTLSQMAAASKHLDSHDQQQQSPTREHSTSTTSQPPVSASSVHPPATWPQASSSSERNGTKRAATNGHHPNSQPSTSQPNGYTHHPPPPAPPTPLNNGYHHNPLDDGEDEGIDLVKGFQPIGAYHQRNHMALGMGMGVAGASSFGH